MKPLLKLLSAGYFVSICVFCFLGYHTYTFLFLVKAPPYPWLAWYVGHAPALYWLAVIISVLAHWDLRRNKTVVAGIVAQALVGIPFALHNVVATLQNDWTAYAWSIAVALPLLVVDAAELWATSSEPQQHDENVYFSYPAGALIATAMAVLSVAGTKIASLSDGKPLVLTLSDAELTLFVLAAHVWLALLIVTVLNLIVLPVRWTNGSRVRARTAAVLLVLTAALQLSLARFIKDTLTMDGAAVQVFAGLLAATVSFMAALVVQPLVAWAKRLYATGRHSVRNTVITITGVAAGAAALLLPAQIRGTDWNGFFEAAFTLGCWAAISVLVYLVRPRAVSYRLAPVLALLLVSGAAYASLKETGFLWATRLGASDDEVRLALQEYEAANTSFSLVSSVFSAPVKQDCDEDCRTLRQYTNIPNASAREPLKLVDHLVPTSGPKPNIFIIVIDSLRSDYLGAYNPAVDFTPNVDALARDSIVLRHAYTQYAGTSLSEPAIWSGALLLHAHYMRPFENVNSLRTLAATDGYQIVASYDHILPMLLSPQDDVVKLDNDRPFTDIELGSTADQLASYLDSRPDKNRPILFYSQPMNVHLLGRNNLPKKTSDNWRDRPSINNYIAYHVHQADDGIGKFIHVLKSRGLYDNSIIIVTADHGEALPGLPDFGRPRRGHSVILFPEVMRVPLIVHLPPDMRTSVVYNDSRLTTLTDITPSLYSLLGHGPIRDNPLFGRPIFAHSQQELDSYHRDHLLLASDAVAAYGVLTGDMHQMYVRYASPDIDVLFDLEHDPDGTRNYVTEELKKHFDQQILSDVRSLAAFYQYKPNGGSTGRFAWDREAQVRGQTLEH